MNLYANNEIKSPEIWGTKLRKGICLSDEGMIFILKYFIQLLCVKISITCTRQSL